MKSFAKIITILILFIVSAFIYANSSFEENAPVNLNKEYLVDVSRISRQIEECGIENIDLSRYEFVFAVEKYNDEDFYNTTNEYVIREIDGEIYRFDYQRKNESNNSLKIRLNIILAVFSAFIFCIIVYIFHSIIRPFEKLKDAPYELAKGNLTAPMQENKSRFFGKFVWGIDMLRENIEQQKQRELEMQKEKKTLLLSLSHDIKTPLSAIKMYSKALSKGLYPDKEKQKEVAENINKKADEIEQFVTQIIEASREDFLSLDVNMSDFYLSDLMKNINKYYSEKLSLLSTEFIVEDYPDCILKGDIDRSIEVVQNIIENAIKYGDGKRISINIHEEDGCILVSVSNTGCSISDTEIPHIFESFWRGSNANNIGGSGLGLYICRQLMNKMNGEIFAEIKDDIITVSAVFSKA